MGYSIFDKHGYQIDTLVIPGDFVQVYNTRPTLIRPPPWYVKPKLTDIIMKIQDIFKLAICLKLTKPLHLPIFKVFFWRYTYA